MFLTLERLCERAGELGSHVRRYIAVVQRHRERVVSHLEGEGLLGRISFGDPARDLRREMELVATAAPDAKARLDFIAFYYALQYIIMEIHSLDVLKYHLIRAEEPHASAYQRCISYAQGRFTELASVYLRILCGTLLEGEFAGRYAILGVGTMGDRDDIDVAVVDDLGEERRAALTRQLAKLGQVMLRTSCNLHFHMAEVLGPPGLSASIERYEELARRRPFDPVVISQMLCATPLAGDESLAMSFARRVTGRFFFHPGRGDRDHEGFLRAMLGEVHELLQRPVSPEFISPKEDGLRALKGFLALSKSIHHVPLPEWFAIAEFLRRRNPSARAEYAALVRGLAFLETARYLYQLLVVEEEEIDTRDALQPGELASIAELMGFHHRGALPGHIPFLMAYYNHVESVRGALRTLLEPIHRHLRRITSLSFFFEPGELEERSGTNNLAIEHARGARTFFGTRYWNDLLEELARPHSAVPGRWVRDLLELSAQRRQVVVRALVAWGVEDPASFLRFLTLIHPHFPPAQGRESLRAMLDLFLERWEEKELVAERLASLYELWPGEINAFLRLLDEPQLERLQELASRRVTREALIKPWRRLRRLLAIHGFASPAFLGHFDKTIESHPQALLQLEAPAGMRSIAETLYGQAERFSDLFSRREWLEAYHHLEAMRLGLELFEGRPYAELLGEYRLGMHILLRSLYFLCRKELYDIYRMEWSKRHSIAIFLDAGSSGFQPFDPELRAGIFLFQEDEELVRFFAEVVSSFEREMRSLGIAIQPCPWEGAAHLSPRRLEEHRELLAAHAEQLGDPLARLEVLKLNRIIGTQGHLDLFANQVVDPLLAPLRGHLEEPLRAHLRERERQLASWPREEPVDPYRLPGGIADLETFELYLRASGGTALPEVLARNTRALHALACARRILRARTPGRALEAAFIREHRGRLARRPEIPADLLDHPAQGFHDLARRNLELMSAHLADARSGS